MPKNAEWNDPSHVGKSLVSIYDVLAEKFFRDSKNADDAKWDQLVKLISCAGYVAQMYASLLKTHEFEKRLKRIEKTLKKTTPGELAMRYSPVNIAEEQTVTDLALR